MDQFRYRFVDDTETVEGVVSAGDPAHAAIQVLQLPADSPRWKRHSIREHDIEAPRDAEFVEFARRNSFSLDIRKAGSRKRKPIRICA